MRVDEVGDAVSTIEEAFGDYSDEDVPLASYALLIGIFNAAFASIVLGARRTGRDLPARLPMADLLLFATATHKLSRLLAKDKVTSVVRAPFTRYESKGGPAEVEEKPRGKGFRRAIGELVTCPYCLDQWIAAGFVSGAIVSPRMTRLVAATFATVAASDFLQILYKAGQKKL
jgi:hypothetical protein